MIRRLQLANWRAYDRLDLELGPGATFVVASNGIGKTSLVMAAAWGIFGDIAGVSGVEEIRADAESATVVVDLQLPVSGHIAITRTVDRRGRTGIEAHTGERTITGQGELEALLAAEFGADARVLAQLTFMIHGGLHETQGEFRLQDHLAGLFGVRPLFDAAARAEALATETAGALRKMKVVERKDQRSAAEIAAEIEAAETALRETTQAREAAVRASDESAERLRVAAEWTNYRAALTERDAKLGAYAEAGGALLGRTLEPEGVVDALVELESEVERSVASAEAEAAEARGKAAFVRDAIARLDTADAACPTCLRPLAEHEADQAAREHAGHLATLDAVIEAAGDRATKQRAVLANLKRILADIRSVPVPLRPASDEEPEASEALRAAHDAARNELRRRDEDVAGRAARIESMRTALAEIEQDRERTSRLEELFRLEALATAAAQALRTTAEAIMTQQIEPLVVEIARRWKQTFGREGLQLSADGRISRTVGGRTLAFGALSGGERVWALLVTRLLVAGASTRAPFVFLDEPLEHLDPRLRRIVAGTLAMASSRTGIRQVVVTTYEAPIAQQLMEDAPSASLLYVTSAE